ncbi:MAG: GNAT family N-acetyltransferase, partial [Acidisphaera sp.]|nr:GNAT family N-acetyltransferase [Acidisphaera sp.]
MNCGDTVAIACNDAELNALVPEWDSLWRRAGMSPFQSPAWLLPWWRQFRTDAPRIVVLRRGGTLAGLLPLYLLVEGNERKLLPLGVGITDYHDVLVDQDDDDKGTTMLLHAALKQAHDEGVTSCVLPDLPMDAILRRIRVPSGWRESPMPETTCPVLELCDALETTVPARMARKIRQNRHRATRLGGWTSESATGTDALALWDDLLRFHGERWAAGGVLGSPLVRAFHRDAIPRLSADGSLRFEALRLRGRVAAVYYTLRVRDRLLFYLSGFDVAEAFCSPGMLLMADLIERA